MAQLPTLTSVMGRLPKAPQVRNANAQWFLGTGVWRVVVEVFSSSPTNYACTVAVSMHSSSGWK